MIEYGELKILNKISQVVQTNVNLISMIKFPSLDLPLVPIMPLAAENALRVFSLSLVKLVTVLPLVNLQTLPFENLRTHALLK